MALCRLGHFYFVLSLEQAYGCGHSVLQTQFLVVYCKGKSWRGSSIWVLLLSPAFSKKSGGTLFWVLRGAWCVARGAWRVARGAWFRVFSRYFVPLTPPTVYVRSF